MGAELEVAEGAPPAPVERHDRGSLREEPRQVHGLAMRVGQREVGSLGADLEGLTGDARFRELPDLRAETCEYLGWGVFALMDR